MIAAMSAARRAGARLMSTGKLSVGSVKWFNLTKGFGARAREKYARTRSAARSAGLAKR